MQQLSRGILTAAPSWALPPKTCAAAQCGSILPKRRMSPEAYSCVLPRLVPLLFTPTHLEGWRRGVKRKGVIDLGYRGFNGPVKYEQNLGQIGISRAPSYVECTTTEKAQIGEPGDTSQN